MVVLFYKGSIPVSPACAPSESLFLAEYFFTCYTVYMPHSVEFLRIIFFDYPALKYLMVFLGTALGGEFFLITFAFLSAQGLVSLFALVPLAFFGTFFSDTVWFLVGRTKRFHSITEHRHVGPTVSVITNTIRHISRGSHFMALVFAKFLFGTRVMTILYISKTHLTLKKFLYYNSYAVLFWVLVVIPIGYSSGLGYTYLGHVFENIYASIGFLIFVAGLIIIGQLWLKNLFTKQNTSGEISKDVEQ